MEWKPHTLLSWFPDPEAETSELPEEFEIDSYWHWLVLPDPPPVASEEEGDEGGEEQEPEEVGPVTTFVFGFDNKKTFGRFKRWYGALGYYDPGPGEEPPEERPAVAVPNFYFDPEFLPRGRPFSIVALSSPPLVTAILREFRLGPEERAFDRVLSVGAPLHPDVPICIPGEDALLVDLEHAPEAIVAIIDTDIAWANARFRRDATSTRIEWFWDMDADCAHGHGLGIGREMFANRAGLGELTINKRLSQFNMNGAVDEAAVYAEYQRWAYSDVTRRRAIRAAGHGTHVLDCAAGADFPAMGTIGSRFPDDTPILAVQLPKLAVDETHGTFLTPYVQLALDRITYLSTVLFGSDPAPRVLVNYSFGGSAGRHDGLSQLEQDFDRRISDGELATINLAAGNSYESRAHARFTGNELNQPQALTMRVQPDDGTPNFAEIWLPVGTAVDALRLTIKPPVGPELKLNIAHPMKVGDVWELAGPRVLARVYIQSDRWPPANLGIARLKITLAIHHTGQHLHLPGHGYGEPVVAGDWGLGFHSEKIAPSDEVMVWVERDDQLPGAMTLARQSFLVPEDDDAVRPIRHDGTISDIATGCETVSAAGFQRSDGEPASYSSEGFALTCGRVYYPTVAGASEEAPALQGIWASGTFSGSSSNLRGTSAATGLVTRACVPIASAGQDVRSGIIGLAGGATPDSRRGWGRINQAIPGKPPRRS